MSKINSFLSKILITSVFLMVGVFSAQADTVLRSGDTVSLAEDQPIEGDFYVAGGKVSVSGAVEEDLLSLAGQATINGQVGKDALLIGGKADVHAEVGDDLRVVAGEITIAKPVHGDILVIGGSVDILSTASITGDVIVFAGEAKISGLVGGNVMGYVGELRIDAPVKGEVDVTVDKLVLGDRADVTGNLTYVSQTPLIKSLSATVGGEETRNDPILPTPEKDVLSNLVPVLVLLFSVLVWYLLSRRTLDMVCNHAAEKPFRSFVIGISFLIVTLIVSAVLITSVLGGLVGGVLIFANLLALFLGGISVIAVFGRLLYGISSGSVRVTLLSILLGTLSVGFCMMLPVLGPLIFTVVMFIGAGSVVDLLHSKHSSK